MLAFCDQIKNVKTAGTARDAENVQYLTFTVRIYRQEYFFRVSCWMLACN